jgi:hypothetical protein
VKGNNDSEMADPFFATTTLPAVSASGTRVTFWSEATNLDPGDTDSLTDVYVKDLTTGDIVLASTSDTGVKGNSESYAASLSADGTSMVLRPVPPTSTPATPTATTTST